MLYSVNLFLYSSLNLKISSFPPQKYSSVELQMCYGILLWDYSDCSCQMHTKHILRSFVGNIIVH